MSTPPRAHAELIAAIRAANLPVLGYRHADEDADASILISRAERREVHVQIPSFGGEPAVVIVTTTPDGPQWLFRPERSTLAALFDDVRAAISSEPEARATPPRPRG